MSETERPRLGIFGINMGDCANADGVRELGPLVEELGYDSIWLGEHIVVASPRQPPSPLEPDFPILDPVVALAMLAGVTSEVRLGTGIIIVPQRNPVVLAKELASLDVLSDGRFEFGVGVGYNEAEMRAVGVSARDRGARTDEYLSAMRSLWYDETPGYQGKFVEFSGMDAYPRPIQRPIPIVVGGESAAALRRVVRLGSGWYGWRLDLARTERNLALLRTEADAAGRDFAELSVTITPTETLTPEVVREYGRLGVDRLVLMPPLARDHGFGLAEFAEFVRANAPARLGARSR
ncbi:MAG TPA: LLM class F420-dependent oxidoreductase [Pseudonocardiaceae bacterium]|nr:LLM class F420-dependent oxidoreductase [Pseudonocardiaceae bacterium]